MKFIRRLLSSRPLTAAVVAFSLAVAAQAANPAPSQLFYVPFPEADALAALDAINTAAVDPMTTAISIAAMADGTVIYYDHWEDGYERDHDYAAPQQSTTKIWGDGNTANGFPPGVPSDLINAGTVIVLTNAVVTTSPLTIDYDGRDKIASTRTISVTRTYWASVSSTLFAGCVETFDTGKWGTEYRAPVGQSLDDATDAQMFEYTALSVLAARDNTTVQIDADNNGSFEATVVLDEGETYFVNGGVNVGGRVLADQPVQVILFCGDVGSNYESRDSSLLPVSRWSNNYYTPVSTADGDTGTASVDATRVWLYNPGGASITVNYQYRIGAGTLSSGSTTVAAGSVAAVQLTAGAAYRFYTSSAPFYAYSTTDSDATDTGDNQAWDWSFTLIPKELLSPQVLVGLGIGRDPYSTANPGENGNPIWVTPVGNGNTAITVYVDYNGDNVGAYTDPNGFKYDLSTNLVELQQQKLYDSDGDQTAMLVYVLSTNVTLAVAWGQDPLTADPSAPGLDVGTSIPPDDVIDTAKQLTVVGNDDGDGQLGPSERARYTIRIGNAARAPIPADIVVTDILPVDTTYVTGSTYYRTSTNGTWIAVTDDGSGTAFPLDGAGFRIQSVLPVKGTFEVRFDVNVDSYANLTPNAVSIINTGTVHAVVYNRTLTFRNETELHGSIGDRVWYDVDGDGVQDGGENGIGGVVVYLDLNTNGVREAGEPTNTTDNTGYYLLTGTFLEAGTHRVRVDTNSLPAGYVQTYDLDSTATPHAATVTLLAGQDRTDVDFGYRPPPASLSGSVFVDVDGDGVADAEDTVGLAGVTILLLDGASNVVATTSTSASGAYSFSNLVAGSYIAVQQLPSGYTNTMDVANPNDLRIPRTLTSGQNSTGNNFYDTRSGTPVAQGKILYLSDPGQALDRVDPVATGDSSTALSGVLTTNAGLATIEVVGAAATSSSTQTATSHSFTYNSGTTGANRILMVGISYRNNDSETVSSVTYGGQTMTQVGTDQIASGTPDGCIYIYQLVNPPTGNNSLAVTWSSALNNYAVVGAVTYAGVNPLTPTGTFASSSSTGSTTPSVTVTSGSGQLAFGVVAGRSTSAYTTSGTQLWSAMPSSGQTAGAGQSRSGASPNVALSWTGTSAEWVAGGVSLQQAGAPGTATVSFVQSPAFALPFSLAAGATITVTSFVNVTSGSLPANPSVTARLSSGGTTFLTLSSPSHSSGTLVWSGNLGSAVNLAAGAAITLTLSNANSGAEFQVRYDSSSYPSKIVLPTTSIIQVPSLAVYDAAYAGGSQTTNSLIAATRYIRVRVTDPFGAADITSAGLTIDGPGVSGDVSTTLGAGQVVASDSWSKTYEYVWNTLALSGDYLITVTANEGTEGITATATTHHKLYSYSIRGQVRDDFDLDGAFSDPDKPVGGVTVRLYSDPNNDGDPADGVLLNTTLTSTNGYYLFTNLTNGNYAVVEIDPVYSVSTADIYGALTDNRIAVTILNADSNGNDFLDAVDPGGYLYDTHDGRIVPGGSIAVAGPGSISLIMDGASGQYMFITDGTPGNYTVTVTPPPGYIIDPRRTPAGASFDPTGGANPTVLGAYESTTTPGFLTTPSAAGNPFYYTFSLAAGDPPVINNNYPLTRFDQIGDRVWNDADADGIQDPGESGIAGAQVRLYDAASNLLATTTSDASGNYAFTNLTPSVYLVRFTTPAGYQTSPVGAGGDPLLDSNADANGWSGPITLAYGLPDFSIDAGYYLPARVFGYVFYESPTNGVRDVGTDDPVTNITVFLLAGGTTNRLAEATTDANGYYNFGGLPPGSYDLQYWVNTNRLTAAPGGADPERNRLPMNSGRIISVTLAAGDGYNLGSEPLNVGLTGSGPLSSAIGVQIIRSAEGTYLEFGTRDEVKAGEWIVVYRERPDGTRVELGRVRSLGGDNIYRLLVPEGLLDPNGPNSIVIVDESGATHVLDGVLVRAFAAERVTMTKQGMELTWSSVPGAVYDIYKTTSLGGAWVPVVVNVQADGLTGHATVPVNPAEPRAFFKVVMRE